MTTVCSKAGALFSAPTWAQVCGWGGPDQYVLLQGQDVHVENNAGAGASINAYGNVLLQGQDVHVENNAGAGVSVDANGNVVVTLGP